MLSNEGQRCREWAEQTQSVTRVYFFGSRVWGEPQPDSDLDIFVFADPALAILEAKVWENELTTLLEVKVHLFHHGLADHELESKVKSEGRLVFSRHKSDRDFEFEELDEIDLEENLTPP